MAPIISQGFKANPWAEIREHLRCFKATMKIGSLDEGNFKLLASSILITLSRKRAVRLDQSLWLLFHP